MFAIAYASQIRKHNATGTIAVIALLIRRNTRTFKAISSQKDPATVKANMAI